MPDQQLPPAGWYPSTAGGGTRRWWDGTKWTDHIEGSPGGAGLSVGTQWPATSVAEYHISETAGQPIQAAVSGTGSGPAWLPDPQGSGLFRWWDGSAWSAHTSQPGSGGASFSSTTVVHVGARKSVGVAFLLTFFFGPFGLFYATITGGVVMLGIEFLLFILGFLTLGAAWFLFFFTWVACIVWGCVAASATNTQVINTTSRF